VRILLLGLVLVAVTATNALATTQPDFIVSVNVSLKQNAVTLSSKQVRRGHYVQFKIRNTTASRRLFSLAGRTIAIPPRKFRYLAISFDVRGTYHYVSRSSAAGNAVRGTFIIT
jgi:hypothetical protein